MTETILMLPLFLLIVFGLLQASQLGVALISINYAASSVAEKEVEVAGTSTSSGPHSLSAQAQAKLNKFMVVGMHATPRTGVRACVQVDGITANLSVWTSAQVNSFPLLGQTLSSIFRAAGKNYSGQSTSGGGCNDDDALGPFYFASDGSYWIVRGKAIARMNYQGR